MERTVYRDILARTGGDIYVGVVGPVRTGKSTLIKRIMEKLVIPNLEDPYRKERARDELPQSGSGKTIMTAEPKFVPEEAVELSPDGTSRLRLRMIDSVGYMVPGAVGATENGEPRLVTTPWFDYEIPMTQAAELGTKKVMEEHCSMGLLVTTDGSVTDIPRADYLEAEARAIRDMKATGKPFVIVVNSREPDSDAAQAIRKELEETWEVLTCTADCQRLEPTQIWDLLGSVLSEFPMEELQLTLPRWMDGLEQEHPIKAGLYQSLREWTGSIQSISQGKRNLGDLEKLDHVTSARCISTDPGRGILSCELQFPETLYYQVLSEKTGFPITGEGELMSLLTELARMKSSYDRIAAALEETASTGYGIVMPGREDLKLETPELTRKGSAYGVKLRAKAPSIHLMRVDLDAEISPTVGAEQQSRELLSSLTRDYQEDREKLWESNIFGKTVYEMVSDGLQSKLHRMPEEVRLKFRGALTRTVNEGANGMICILF